MFKQIDYTMVVVSDMDRSVEFYRDHFEQIRKAAVATDRDRPKH